MNINETDSPVDYVLELAIGKGWLLYKEEAERIVARIADNDCLTCQHWQSDAVYAIAIELAAVAPPAPSEHSPSTLWLTPPPAGSPHGSIGFRREPFVGGAAYAPVSGSVPSEDGAVVAAREIAEYFDFVLSRTNNKQAGNELVEIEVSAIISKHLPATPAVPSAGPGEGGE